jgi:hypothetical protein
MSEEIRSNTTSDAEPPKKGLGKFFFLWFGIPFIIILALGYLMSMSDSW